MTENAILEEVKKAIDLLHDNTYVMTDFYNHILLIIKESNAEHFEHKNKMERLIYKVEEMREAQRLFWAGHKNKLFECKQLESDMDKKTHHLQVMGYDIDRFKNKIIQQSLL